MQSTTVSELLADAPPELVIPGARPRIRQFNRETGRRIVVLDDDPTGSQSVHDVQVLTVLDRDAYRAGLADAGTTSFLLTNTRGLPASDAVVLNRTIATDILTLARDMGAPVELVSRSDSCLRGHVVAEIDELIRVSAERDRAVDGVLFVPALFTAGRFTLGDTHWAVVDGTPVPVGETEFARDATFGYTRSHLPTFLNEVSGGRIERAGVLSVSLADIRRGGPRRVAEILDRARGGCWVVVNAITDHDLDVVVLGLQDRQRHGRRFLYRTGPSFVRAIAGLDPRPALTARDLHPPPGGIGSGLVVIGSHTRITTGQLDRLRGRGGVTELELDVPTLLDPARRDGQLTGTAAAVRSALGASDVVLRTSRTLTVGRDARHSLEIARAVSDAVVDVVARVRTVRPDWVLAKGGITSHDVAARGLGIRRARVAGQLSPGVSVFEPLDAPDDVRGRPYVVFPGNVGAPEALADAVATLRQVPTPENTPVDAGAGAPWASSGDCAPRGHPVEPDDFGRSGPASGAASSRSSVAARWGTSS